MFKAAIVGCGRIAGEFEDLLETQKPCTHAGSYHISKKISLEWINDFDLQKVQSFANRWSIPENNCFTSTVDMFSSCDIDVLSICTPCNTHFEIIKLAVDTIPSLKVIWCEKPLADSPEKCREINRICKEKGVKVVVNYWRRYDDFHRYVADLIRSQEVGEVYAYDCESHVGLMNCGTHLLDLLLMYSSENLKSVKGEIRPDGSNDPGALGYFELSDGKKVLFDCVWKENPKIGVTVRGEKGKIVALTNKVLIDEVFVHKKDESKTITRSEMGFESPYKNLIRDIEDALEKDSDLYTDSHDAAESIEAVAAIYMSDKTDQIESIPVNDVEFKDKNYDCRITSMTKDGTIPDAWRKP